MFVVGNRTTLRAWGQAQSHRLRDESVNEKNRVETALGLADPGQIDQLRLDEDPKILEISIGRRTRRPVCLPRVQGTELPGLRHQADHLAALGVFAYETPACTHTTRA